MTLEMLVAGSLEPPQPVIDAIEVAHVPKQLPEGSQAPAGLPEPTDQRTAPLRLEDLVAGTNADTSADDS
jgi:hypothetical protein